MKTALTTFKRPIPLDSLAWLVSNRPFLPIVILGVALAMLFANSEASEKFSLPLCQNVTRADIYVEPCKDRPKATLVLCPGSNGNGRDWVEAPAWKSFAKVQRLNLVGLSFASDDGVQDRGYFEASGGSGQLLLDGLGQALGPKQLPLLLFGFSRGAQFTYSFASWKSDRVTAWCAYSATGWEIPKAENSEPKGLIACGDEDESNYSFSLLQFLKGRSMSKPWTWISLDHMGHARSPALEDFVRTYFAAVLAHPQSQGIWMDVDTKTQVGLSEVQQNPTLVAWLPDETVAQTWKTIHQP